MQIVNVPRMDSSLNPIRYAICSTIVPHGYHYNGFMATPELKHRMSKYLKLYVPVPHFRKWTAFFVANKNDKLVLIGRGQ